MKTTLISLSLVTAALALAAPAAAECTNVDATGGYVCAFTDDPKNLNVGAFQPGLGGASADTYEFSFFGQTYKGKNAYVYTDPSSPAGAVYVAVNDFCFANMAGECVYQDTGVTIVSDATGYTWAGISQTPDGRTLCYSAGGEFGCQAL